MSEGAGLDVPGTAQDHARHMAEGEAALVLLESLIHTLIAKGVLNRQDAIAAIEAGAAVKRTMAQDGSATHLSNMAAGILTRMGISVSATSDSKS